MSFIKHVFNPKKHTLYKPAFPEKYVGSGPIICRSSWENEFCRWLDYSANVLKWASEPVEIPYFDPVDRKQRRYNPDFLALMNSNNNPQWFLVEIKPKKQAKPPRNSKKKTQSQLLQEKFLYMRNQAKWMAAEGWCAKNGVKFVVITEDELHKKRGR